MAEWTQKEIEELMAEMTRKAMTDPEFRQEVLEDATVALEKLAGRPLPMGVSFKCIERDPNYQSTFVLPDLLDEEKLDDQSLTQVAGGVSVALIASVCIAAAGVGPDAAYCGYKACAADLSIQGCGNRACAGEACIKDEIYVSENCAGHACFDFQKDAEFPTTHSKVR